MYLSTLIKGTYIYPFPLMRTACVNLFRKNSIRSRKDIIFFTSYSIADIHTSSKLFISGKSIFGFKKYKGSRLETSLWMDENSRFDIGCEHDGIQIYHGCDIQIFRNAKLSIGGGTIMNRAVQIICQDDISIGKGCLISRDVVIRDNDGGHTIVLDGYKKTLPVHIGNHVWIGQGAIILKGTLIGDGAIIGAGAVVSGRVKANSLVMADPSRTFAKDIKWEQ